VERTSAQWGRPSESVVCQAPPTVLPSRRFCRLRDRGVGLPPSPLGPKRRRPGQAVGQAVSPVRSMHTPTPLLRPAPLCRQGSRRVRGMNVGAEVAHSPTSAASTIVSRPCPGPQGWGRRARGEAVSQKRVEPRIAAVLAIRSVDSSSPQIAKPDPAFHSRNRIRPPDLSQTTSRPPAPNSASFLERRFWTAYLIAGGMGCSRQVYVARCRVHGERFRSDRVPITALDSRAGLRSNRGRCGPRLRWARGSLAEGISGGSTQTGRSA
jgi:hypothetical protein